MADQDRIAAFLDQDILIHRHLDWRAPLDWLGEEPFLLLEISGKLQALMVCPADPPGVYWLRIFAADLQSDLDGCWQKLFKIASQVVQRDPAGIMASLAYQPWMIPLLEESGFQVSQQVVQLRWSTADPKNIPNDPPSGLAIRRMRRKDILPVESIDQACFEPTWRHSADGLSRALDQSDYATVAEWDGTLVGYQLSTSHLSRIHLARLAVLPQKQGLHIGRALVVDMLKHYRRPWIREITVNTQHNNQRSLSLYHDLGFSLTGDQFPIYTKRS